MSTKDTDCVFATNSRQDNIYQSNLQELIQSINLMHANVKVSRIVAKKAMKEQNLEC